MGVEPSCGEIRGYSGPIDHGVVLKLVISGCDFRIEAGIGDDVAGIEVEEKGKKALCEKEFGGGGEGAFFDVLEGGFEFLGGEGAELFFDVAICFEDSVSTLVASELAEDLWPIGGVGVEGGAMIPKS